MIGSSNFGLARGMPSRNAARAAISNAITDEVDVVVGTVMQRRLEVDHRETEQNAGLARRCQTLLDARDIFARHVPPTTLLSKV